MNDLATVTLDDVTAMETKDELKVAADSLGLGYSGNIGEGTLRKKLQDFLTVPLAPAQDEQPTAPIAPLQSIDDLLGTNQPAPEIIAQPKIKGARTIPDLLLMDPSKETDPILVRQIVRAKALRISRVHIINLDPADADLSGGIVTVMNKYTGKVSKYIPYGEESANGYHIPEILLNHLRSQVYALRKVKKGGSFGVKQYKTSMVPKFSITILPPLSEEELAALALTQSASQSVDD